MSTTVSTVGIVGLGLVGSALAQRLRAAGFRCVGYDVQASACERFAKSGGELAETPAELARQARTVIMAVMETRDVLTAVEGPQGLLVGGTPQAIIDCSTGDPDLLVALAERAGRVLTRDQIMEAVRGRELEAFDRSIDVHMGRIRAAIETDVKAPKRILTVRGVGYVFAKQQD